MKVSPKTEKELVESRLLPKGWYPFTIGEAKDALSKAAKERGETEPNMIELNVQVYKESGFVFVKDWLMDTEFGAHKLRHCAATCDLLEDYEGGSLAASMFLGREGYVRIGVQKSKTDFPDQNKIEDYAKQPPEKKEKDEAAPSGRKPPTDPDLDAPEDDIPF